MIGEFARGLGRLAPEPRGEQKPPGLKVPAVPPVRVFGFPIGPTTKTVPTEEFDSALADLGTELRSEQTFVGVRGVIEVRKS